jgi:chromosome segregation ATPase
MSIRNGETELQKNLRRVTELKAEIADLEGSRDGLLDWMDRQNQKCKEIQAKVDDYNKEFTEKNNILHDRNKELVQKEQVLIRRELEFQKLMTEANSARMNAETAKKEVNMMMNNVENEKLSLQQRIAVVLERETKVDAAMSYIQSVFKTIEKLKV